MSLLPEKTWASFPSAGTCEASQVGAARNHSDNAPRLGTAPALGEGRERPLPSGMVFNENFAS
jgi:hypothetical protein